MGKKHHRGKQKGGSAGSWANHRPRSDYTEIEKSNKMFEAYYNGLPIAPAEELDTFWKAMKTDLPNSFRFTGSKGHALAVQQRLIDHYIPQITSVRFDGEYVAAPKQVEWFPEKLAWSMTTPKQIIRKFAPFSSFQKFLVSETSVGNISRQEIVSMIPPLLMDIKPGMTVLDMCAAPGSKSAQLIEMVHRGEETRTRQVVHNLEKQSGQVGSPDGQQVDLEQSEAEMDGDWSDDGRSTGLLVANDSDYRRAQMLVHQVKRLNSPNLLVTNHDASIFPSIRIPSNPGSNVPRYLKFDRVLADVPCTGDGTARKNAGIWRDWMPSTAMGLHNLQVRILVRALQMLKKGGRAVYSTCSLNPVENEAVVASAIEACGGLENVRIMDCNDQLPQLKRVAGLNTWKLMDRYERFFSSWEELEAARSDPDTKNREVLSKFTPGMFPRTSNDDGHHIPLERCMRVYPHLQDTGGFFITVLEKIADIRVQTGNLRKATTTNSNSNSNSNSKTSVGIETENVEKNEDEIMIDASDETVIPDSETQAPQKRKRDDQSAPRSPTKKPKSDSTGAHHALESAPDEGLSALSTTKSITANPDAINEAEPVSAPSREESSTENGSVGAAKSDTKLTKLSAPDINSRDVMTFKPKHNQPHEEPYKYLDPDHAVLQSIYDFYKISARFPKDRYMVRNATGEPVKAIYYTSNLVRDILILNEGKGMKFVQAGVKMFMRQDAQGQDICRWRIQSEGTPILESWIGEDRVIRLHQREPLRLLLLEMFIKIEGPSWPALGTVGKDIKDIPMGCCLLKVEPSEAKDSFKERIVLPIWRSIAAANVMLPKEERKALLLRLFNDSSPLVDHSQLKARDAKTEDDSFVDAEHGLTPGEDLVLEAADAKEDLSMNQG